MARIARAVGLSLGLGQSGKVVVDDFSFPECLQLGIKLPFAWDMKTENPIQMMPIRNWIKYFEWLPYFRSKPDSHYDCFLLKLFTILSRNCS